MVAMAPRVAPVRVEEVGRRRKERGEGEEEEEEKPANSSNRPAINTIAHDNSCNLM